MKKKKPANKEKPSPAVLTLATIERPADGTPAQQKAPSAPRPTPDAAAAPQLWMDFEMTAYKLAALSVSAPETVDSDKLKKVLLGCFNILLKNSTSGGAKEKEAIENLYFATHFGCLVLAEASKNEKSMGTVKAFASGKEDWPWMLSPQKSSYEAAKVCLRRIGVGTKSVLPTAYMNAAAENRWRNLARKLMKDIIAYRKFLGKPRSPTLQKQAEKLFPEAKKCPEIGGLPEMLNTDTWERWWKVAETMLKAYLDTHPTEAKALFNLVRQRAGDDDKTPEYYVTREVKRAFRKIVAKQGAQ